MTSRTGPEEMTHNDSGASDWDRLRERAQLLDLIQTFGQPLEVDPEVKALGALLAAAAALDAQDVPTDDRMLWDGTTLHGPINADGPGAFSRWSCFVSPQVSDPFAWPAPVKVEIPPLVPVRVRAPGRANRLTMALRAAYP